MPPSFGTAKLKRCVTLQPLSEHLVWAKLPAPDASAVGIHCQEPQAENVTVLEGGTAQISCRLQNYDGSIVVIQNPRRQTLFFNGTRALKDDRFQMVLFTQRLVRITLTNVSVSDEGGYFCQLYTDSTHHQVATLSVLVPPGTPTVEVKQEAVEGGEAELTCVSPRSKPAATLRWMRKRREIAGVVSLQDNGKTFSVSSTIRIPVERNDNGTALSCEAFHPALNGQKRIRHYRLDVYYAPCPGLTLTCSLTLITLTAVVFDGYEERAEVFGQNFSLVLKNIKHSDSGDYTAVVVGGQEQSIAEYKVIVQGINCKIDAVCSSQNNIYNISHAATPTLTAPAGQCSSLLQSIADVPVAVVGIPSPIFSKTSQTCIGLVSIFCTACGYDHHVQLPDVYILGNWTSEGQKKCQA
ncbi:hypothetical protein ACER0C_013180 [Sarotherodon galilaeus]